MTDTQQTPEPEPAAEKPVVAALLDVMAELPSIGRGERSEQGYNYRGIESITQHLQPLLARHGVVIVPRVLARFTKELTVNNKPWTEEQLTVEYTAYGRGGDSIVIGPIVGLGRDNSDKGTTKALTQAFKYALIQTFCIADKKDDGDQHTAEADAKLAPADAVVERIKALGGAVRAPFGEWLKTNEMPTKSGEWSDDHVAAINKWLDAWVEPAPETPGEQATAPNERPAAESAPDTAPNPETAPVAPASAPEPEPAQPSANDYREAILLWADALPLAQVNDLLNERGVKPDKSTPKYLRHSLAEAVIASGEIPEGVRV